jgi:hypothetical protein
MSLAFPSSPTLNQQANLLGTTWTYTASGWRKATSNNTLLKTANGVALTGSGDAVIPGAPVGIYASAAALQTAFPAAANAGKTGLVGAAAPYAEYASDGVVWNANLTGAQVSSAVTYNSVSNTLGSGSTPIALKEVTPYITVTTTGITVTGPCELAGFDCTVAAGNITIYDGLSTTGNIIVSTTALTLSRTEFNWKRALNTGCYVVLSGAATVNVLVG